MEHHVRGLRGQRTAMLAAVRRAAPRPRPAGERPGPCRLRPGLAWEILLAVGLFGGALVGGAGL